MTVVLPSSQLAVTLRRQGPRWRRRWPLPASVLLHAVVGGICLLGLNSPAPPMPLPQIDLLPPAPVAPMPLEAAPSPAEAVLKPLPAFPKLSPPPPAPQVLRPLLTTGDRAEPVLPKPPKQEPPKLPSPEETPVDIPSKTAVDAAATPVSGAKTAANTILGDAADPRPAGPPPDYIGLIRARLEKVKRYPATARNAGREGTVLLSFVLDRSGQVVLWTITRGSGTDALDQEVGEMIQRATFPPFPAAIDHDRLQLLVPVEFSLTRP